jgi:hypothetical protein
MRTDRSLALTAARACGLAAFMWLSADAGAQSVRGSVERASGGPAPYAIVVFSQNGQEKARAITDSAGSYYVRQVAPGKYDVTVMSRAGNTSQVATVPASGATLNLRTK